jgi:hypothetical protein
MVEERKGIYQDNETKLLKGSAVLYYQENIDPIKDGDTVGITFNGSIHSRFLNVDTAEKGLFLPDPVIKLLTNDELKQWKTPYRPINHARWVEYLEDPFNSTYTDSTKYMEALGPDLVNYIKGRTGNDCARNHHEFASKASKTLSEKIKQDKKLIEIEGKKFGLRLEFSHEIFERYGRVLCHMSKAKLIDGKMANEQESDLAYNEMLLATGNASPYFIFPNTDGFRNAFSEKFSLLKSIPDVNDNQVAFYQFMQDDTRLQKAIGLVREARKLPNSIWDPAKPLKLQPFELRYLQRRGPPDRYVMNLSSKEPKIYPSRKYYEIPLEEDRFYIPYDYVLLFKCRGYNVIEEDIDCSKKLL